MSKKILSLALFSLIAVGTQAGQVARGQIDEMVNLIGVEKLFSIRMSASSAGPCAGQWVKFKESNFAGNLESYRFAFSLAATAIVSGKSIRVHNYSGNSCDGVTFIGLYK